ncbi:pirin family protein [Myxococcota bacterium]|nr:pirin family protein [Myxococcota bacterium]
MMSISQVLQAKSETVGDLTVRRVLPRRERRSVGPFVFLDHMGPHRFVARADGGVPPHPHIGLATVTYLFEGEMLHRDSVGTEQVITPGDVNWMTAGAGIVHSERVPPHLVGRETSLEGLQVWVGLPSALEESAPSFEHVPRASLPSAVERGASVRVVLGTWAGATSPVRVASPTLYVAAELEPGASLVIPADAAEERALYVVSGAVRADAVRGDADAATIGATNLAVLTPGAEGRVVATEPTRLAVIGGAPLDGPRYMKWNFVSSRRARVEQAWDDWQAGRFPRLAHDPSDGAR